MPEVKIEQILKERGYQLPALAEAMGLYVPAVKVNDLVFTAGLLPEIGDDLKFAGKLGKDLTIEQGQRAAELCALNALSIIKEVIGDLDKIKRIVRVVGYINSAPGFTDQPKVLNGASKLLIDIFGERGKHARLALGIAELPINAALEMEMIVQVA